MALMFVKVCVWHWWLQISIPVIDGCGGQFTSLMAAEVCIYAKDGCRGLYMVIINCRVQYMPLMTVDVCIWHLWLWRSVYGIYGC